MDSWASSLKTLRNQLDKDDSRIEDLLDWFEANINDPRLPTIRNAKEFKNQFGWIEDVRRKKALNARRYKDDHGHSRLWDDDDPTGFSGGAENRLSEDELA